VLGANAGCATRNNVVGSLAIREAQKKPYRV
jgi:hypothetical protein